MNEIEENKCIKAVRDGMKEGFTHLTPEMEKLFRLVYRLGYKQCKIDQLQKELDSQ